MMREGPVPAPGWDRQRMAAPGRPYAGLERLVGGRRQRLVRNPAADTQAMMLPGSTSPWEPAVEVAGHRLAPSRWSPERPMREALDWLVDRLASGWAIHAALRADKGEAAYLPHGPWPRPGMRPSWPNGCLLGKSSPTRRPGNWTGVRRSPLGGDGCRSSRRVGRAQSAPPPWLAWLLSCEGSESLHRHRRALAGRRVRSRRPWPRPRTAPSPRPAWRWGPGRRPDRRRPPSPPPRRR
jgi:hypothetical protein